MIGDGAGWVSIFILQHRWSPSVDWGTDSTIPGGVCYTREAREVVDDNMVPRGGVLSDFFWRGKADWRVGPTMPATAQERGHGMGCDGEIREMSRPRGWVGRKEGGGWMGRAKPRSWAREPNSAQVVVSFSFLIFIFLSKLRTPIQIQILFELKFSKTRILIWR